MTLTLTLKEAPPLRVDLDSLVPARLATLATQAIERLPLRLGSDTVAVADLFRVRVATDDAPLLRLEGDLSRFDRIGQALATGRIDVRGPAGDYLGLGLAGGSIAVDGPVGDYAAAEAASGRITIAGRAGDFTAAALPGNLNGMRGATVIIDGDAGERSGDRMRRGTLIIGGQVGPLAGSRMVAGTLAVAGPTGPGLATGMRRGSLVLLRPFADPAGPGPMFSAVDSDFPVFWTLLSRLLMREHRAFAALAGTIPRRLVGDASVDGRGEILVAPS